MQTANETTMVVRIFAIFLFSCFLASSTVLAGEVKELRRFERKSSPTILMYATAMIMSGTKYWSAANTAV